MLWVDIGIYFERVLLIAMQGYCCHRTVWLKPDRVGLRTLGRRTWLSQADSRTVAVFQNLSFMTLRWCTCTLAEPGVCSSSSTVCHRDVRNVARVAPQTCVASIRDIAGMHAEDTLSLAAFSECVQHELCASYRCLRTSQGLSECFGQHCLLICSSCLCHHLWKRAFRPDVYLSFSYPQAPGS